MIYNLFARYIYALTAVCSLLSLGGCAAFTPVDVAKPSDITLEQATTQVAQSFVAMKSYRHEHDTTLGLTLDEVDVDFNVTAGASANAGQDLKIDASNIAMAGVGATADINGQQTSQAQRGNTIHMVFKSAYTAPLNCYGVSVFYGKIKPIRAAMGQNATPGYLALPIHDDLRFGAYAAFGTSGRTGSFGLFTA